MANRLAVAGLAIVAFAARAVYLIQIQGSPVVEHLLIDSETYDRFARRIIEGTFSGEEVYSMNILYPYFLSAIYRLSGAGISGVPWVQAVLDTSSCLGIAWIGTSLFSTRVGLLAGIGAALYGPFVFYSGAILTPALINFLCVLTLVLLVKWQGAPRRSVAIAAGLALGLAALGRGNSILLVPLALAFFLQRGGKEDWKRMGGHWLLFTAGAASLLVVATVRNYFVEGRLVPVSANYAAFYIGHNEHANGLYTLPDFIESASFEGEVRGTQAAVSAKLGRPVTLAESASYLFSEGLRYVRENPGDDFRRTLKKFYFFWNTTESPTNLNYYFARDHSSILRALPVTFGWLVPPALLGAMLAWRSRRRHAILYLYGAVYLLTAILFFVSAEYRAPIVPVVLIFAAHGLFELLANARTPRRLAWMLALLVVAALFCNYRTPLLRAQSLKRVDYLNFGTLYRAAGDLPRAEAMLRQSLSIDPTFAPAYEGLAEVYRLRGDDREAARYLGEARKFLPQGQYDRGDRKLDERTEALLEVATVYEAGDYPGALAGFRQLLVRYRQAGDEEMVKRLENNIGLCHYKMEEFDHAEQLFLELIERDPTYVKGYYNLGKVREGQGRDEEALQLYRRALAIDPNYRNAGRAIEELHAR